MNLYISANYAADQSMTFVVTPLTFFARNSHFFVGIPGNMRADLANCRNPGEHANVTAQSAVPRRFERYTTLTRGKCYRSYDVCANALAVSI